MIKTGRFALAMGLALALGGCDSTEPQTPETVKFAASLGINLAAMTKLPSGVYIQTITPGTGVALKVTDWWSINYKGSLANGTVFDTQPLFKSNFSQVIQGFEGMVGMTKGEMRKMVIPSELGYGLQDNGPIPGGSVLIFEVTLLAINP